jgi:hypothetical protein
MKQIWRRIQAVFATIGTRNAFDTTQSTNYLNATGLACSLLLNFGNRRLETKRLLNNAS